jgi:Zn-dependent protease
VSGLSLPELTRLLALNLLVMVLSLSVHECAHAWVAYRLGDDTAKREGRLSLNPSTHVDPFGTLLIPALSVFMGGAFGFIGWARPCPVDPKRFRRSVSMRNGMALTAAAGPLSNLVLALLALGAFAVCQRAGVSLWDTEGRASGVTALLVTMFRVNVGLMVFNFLPIPPLDGSRLLPRSMDEFQARIAPYSIVLLLIVLNVPILSKFVVLEPIRLVSNVLQAIFQTQIFDGIA